MGKRYDALKELVDNKEGYPEEFIEQMIPGIIGASDFKYEKGMVSLPAVHKALLSNDYGKATTIAKAYSTRLKKPLLKAIVDESNLKDMEIFSYMSRIIRWYFYVTKGSTNPIHIAALMNAYKWMESDKGILDSFYSYLKQGYNNGDSPLLNYQLIPSSNTLDRIIGVCEYKPLEEVCEDFGTNLESCELADA